MILKSLMRAGLTLVWGCVSVYSSVVVPASLERMICEVDVIAVGQVMAAGTPTDVTSKEGPPRYEDMRIWKYPYEFQITQVIAGKIDKVSTPIPFFSRSSMSMSFISSESGIETELQPKKSYVLLIRSKPMGNFELVRAENQSNLSQVTKIFRARRCGDKRA